MSFFSIPPSRVGEDWGGSIADMADYLVPEPQSEDPAQAFEALRGEVSLLRHAVEGLTAARDRMPDYSPTLAATAETLQVMTKAVSRIEQSPAVKTTFPQLAAEIGKAGTDVRAEDRASLHGVRDALLQAVGRVDGIVERGQAADQQLRRLIWCSVGAAIVGMLLMAVMPGAIARSLPESWHVPEWMAARVLRMEQSAAGKRLVETAPQHKQGGDIQER